MEIGYGPRSEQRELVVIEFALSYVAVCKKTVGLQRLVSVDACGDGVGEGVENLDLSWKLQMPFFADHV